MPWWRSSGPWGGTSGPLRCVRPALGPSDSSCPCPRCCWGPTCTSAGCCEPRASTSPFCEAHGMAVNVSWRPALLSCFPRRCPGLPAFPFLCSLVSLDARIHTAHFGSGTSRRTTCIHIAYIHHHLCTKCRQVCGFLLWAFQGNFMNLDLDGIYFFLDGVILSRAFSTHPARLQRQYSLLLTGRFC